MMTEVLAADQVDAVHEFALPLQCRALTRLLNVPESEADIWKDWGLHALTEGEGLEEYTAEQFAKAEEQPGEDFFSMLNQVEFRGRNLTMEEKQGIANVTFAGGGYGDQCGEQYHRLLCRKWGGSKNFRRECKKYKHSMRGICSICKSVDRDCQILSTWGQGRGAGNSRG